MLAERDRNVSNERRIEPTSSGDQSVHKYNQEMVDWESRPFFLFPRAVYGTSLLFQTISWSSKKLGLECGHRERERIAFAKSNRQTNEAEIQIRRWEISDYTNITTISSYSLSLSLRISLQSVWLFQCFSVEAVR